jgi:hypothetical protein
MGKCALSNANIEKEQQRVTARVWKIHAVYNGRSVRGINKTRLDCRRIASPVQKMRLNNVLVDH